MKNKPKEELKLDKEQLDELKEVGNICAGKTSIALSRMVNKKVIVKLTKLTFSTIDDIQDLLENPADRLVGLCLGIKGDLEGNLLLLNPEKTSCMIIDLINGNPDGTTKKVGDCDKDILKEMGNILVGAYLAAMSDLSKLALIESLPELFAGTGKEVVASIIKKFDGQATHALTVGTELCIEEEKFKERLVLLLDNGSFKQLFNALSKI